MNTLPRLVFSDDSLEILVQKLVTPKSLIVTDDYNFPKLQPLGNTVLAKDQEIDHIKRVRLKHYSDVIAVGGCTALDFGRACSIGKTLIAVPTILSNSCLSTNRSVIKHGDSYYSEQTSAPQKTIISLPTIVENHQDQIKHWSASGIGDLLSSLSASIEYEYNRASSLEQVSVHQITANVPLEMEALAWINKSYKEFDKPTLKRLATYLHQSSLKVIKIGSTQLNAGSEHKLYYKLQEQQQYQKTLATHGRLVSIGNLISTKVYSEVSGHDELYLALRQVHAKVGLPLTYADLQAILVEKEHIIKGLKSLINTQCLYGEYFADNRFEILDSIFEAAEVSTNIASVRPAELMAV